jgi:phage tail tape-measure protein
MKRNSEVRIQKSESRQEAVTQWAAKKRIEDENEDEHEHEHDEFIPHSGFWILASGF